MRPFFFLALAFVGCATAPTLAVRDYDAGPFVIRYQAPARVDPVFTAIARSPQDRADGMIYITSDAPGGFFGTSPGQSISIYLIPAARFRAKERTEAGLAASLPRELKENHPDEVYDASVKRFGNRAWVECISRRWDAETLITGVSYYSYADPEHLLYLGWDYPRRVSFKTFDAESPYRAEILLGISVQEKKPNKTLEDR